jgi:hypothetical protein
LDKRSVQKAILELLCQRQQSANKFNLIGNEHSLGDIESKLGLVFNESQRVLADAAFEALRANGYIRPNYNSLHDPANWLVVSETGRQFLNRGLRDQIDLALARIGEHLVELRAGMHDAANRTSPDAPRHAVNAARELIDQILKEGALPACKTRKQRIEHLLTRDKSSTIASGSDIKIIEACCKLIEAEHNKTMGKAHARAIVNVDEARLIVEAAERTLRLLFAKKDV